MSSSNVTIEALATAKRLAADDLVRFGLMDKPYGVQFTYWNLDGSVARPRRRTAMRGAAGSSWEPNSQLPVVPYVRPGHSSVVAAARYLIVVEGESDCWTAWTHGVPALGIPGADQVHALTIGHLRGVDRIYLQREEVKPGSSTFPRGIDSYLCEVCGHIRRIGYLGEVYEMRLPAGIDDISALHCADPQRFVDRLQSAMQTAQPFAASESLVADGIGTI